VKLTPPVGDVGVQQLVIESRRDRLVDEHARAAHVEDVVGLRRSLREHDLQAGPVDGLETPIHLRFADDAQTCGVRYPGRGEDALDRPGRTRCYLETLLRAAFAGTRIRAVFSFMVCLLR